MGNPNGMSGGQPEKQASSEDEMDYNQQAVLSSASRTLFNKSGGIKIVNPNQITQSLQFQAVGQNSNDVGK